MGEADDVEFDIFKGTCDKDARWVEAVNGLAAARERMEAIAAQHPGQYFVFGQRSHAILARTDTRKAVFPAAINRDEAKSA